jgi:hypothetical protein
MRLIMYVITVVLLILDASAALPQENLSIMTDQGIVVGRQSSAVSFLGN